MASAQLKGGPVMPSLTMFGGVSILCCFFLLTETYVINTGSANDPRYSLLCSMHYNCNTAEKPHVSVTKVDLVPADTNPCTENIKKNVSSETALFLNSVCINNPKSSNKKVVYYNGTDDYGCTQHREVTTIQVEAQCTSVPVAENSSTAHSSATTSSSSATTSDTSTFWTSNQDVSRSTHPEIGSASSQTGASTETGASTDVAGILAAIACSVTFCAATIMVLVLCHRRQLLCFKKLQDIKDHLSENRAGPKPEDDQEFHDYATVDYNQEPSQLVMLAQRYSSKETTIRSHVKDESLAGHQQPAQSFEFTTALQAMQSQLTEDNIVEQEITAMAENDLYAAE